MTPWKEQDRRRREIYVPSGAPDAQVRQGIFYRAINRASPHLNSRDGIVRGRRISSLDLQQGDADHASADLFATWVASHGGGHRAALWDEE